MADGLDAITEKYIQVLVEDAGVDRIVAKTLLYSIGTTISSEQGSSNEDC